MRLGEYVSVGVLYERGLARTAHAPRSTQPPVDHGDVTGYGYTMALSLPMDEHLRIGVSTEVMLWMVPWVEYAVCVDCASPYQTMRSATDGNFTVDAGAEVELAGRVRTSLVLAQTLTEDPVAYGPSLGVMVTIPLGTLPPPPPSVTVASAAR